MQRLIAAAAVVLLVSFSAASFPCAADPERYVAVFSDGAVLEGNDLQLWHDARSMPTLEGASLEDPGNPLRWIRDRRLREKAYKYFSESFVEFVGGDRLPGTVGGGSFADQGSALSHLLVKTDGAFARPGRASRKHVRILASKGRRAVWRRMERQTLTPGVAYLRNGQALDFRRLRWGEGTVSILLAEGVKEFAFGELAEIHTAAVDPWESYYDDLAVLSPTVEGRLFRLETVDGLIATSSRSRFQALAFSSPEEQQLLAEKLRAEQGQLNNFDSHNKESLKKIEDLQKKLDDELKKQAEVARPGGKEETRARVATERYLSQMEQRLQRRLDTHDRLTRNLEKNRLRQLKKLPEAQRKSQMEALSKDRLRQREQIEKQIAEEARKTRAQRQQQDQRKIDRLRVLKRDQLRRLENSRTADQLLSRIDAYNNWLASMEKIRKSVDLIKGARGAPDSWQHMAQPSWSLDPIWAAFKRIHTYMFFRPDEVPLSRFCPVEFHERHYLAKAAGWRIDRNSRNAFLSSASREYGWGYAVHAYNELHFDLAPLVTGFSSRLGLDRQVGNGGCALGRVFLGSRDAVPLYESPFLVGSWQTVDTGELKISGAPGARRRLILQADTAHDEDLSAVDPFDVRDMVDWLEPVLQLDRKRLAEIVKERIHLNVPAWRNWTPTLSEAAACDWETVFENRGDGAFFPAVSLRGAPIVLSCRMPAADWRKWLQVDMSQINALRPDPSILSVRVDGREIKPSELPQRQPWQVGSIPLLYDLGTNKDASVTVEITQQPGKELICWRKLEVASSPPAVYELSKLLDEAGGRDVQLTQAIGRVLKSVRLGFEEKRAALQLYRLGAEINYRKKSPVATTKIIGSKDLWQAAARHSSTMGDTPRNAIDGNPDTRWTSQYSQRPGMWFSLEFPGPTVLGGVRLLTPGSNDHPVSYQVFASMDGVKWSGMLAKGVGTSPVTEAIFEAVDAKFLRIVQTGKTTLWWSINEVEVLEPETVDVVSSVLLGEKWHGDDEGLTLLKKIPTLATVHFSGEIRNSSEARRDLQESLGFVGFEMHERIPSHSGTPACDFNVINKTGKDLKIVWISFNSEYTGYPDLAAGESSVRESYVGHRWEAQTDGRRVGFYVVEPGLDWVVTDEE